jgi:hypothetical protein
MVVSSDLEVAMVWARRGYAIAITCIAELRIAVPIAVDSTKSAQNIFSGKRHGGSPLC